jgi:hypothetical protein
LQPDRHDQLILEFMCRLEAELGGSVPIDTIVEYAIDQGVGFNDIEGALVHASANGWIQASDHHIHLTKTGHRLLNPANDNQLPPHT